MKLPEVIPAAFPCLVLFRRDARRCNRAEMTNETSSSPDRLPYSAGSGRAAEDAVSSNGLARMAAM
jgi:hypothetical protein